MKKVMTYPTICTSAYCGEITCDGCEHKENLDAFKKWEKENNASSDKTCSSAVYIASSK